MGREMIRVEDRNLYIEWSSITDMPTFFGTRKQALAYLTTPIPGQYYNTDQDAERILATADKYGSSAPKPFGTTYDVPAVRYGANYQVPRDKLFRMTTLIKRNPVAKAGGSWDDVDLSSILEPFGD